MIRVDKPPVGPRILAHANGRGPKETQKLRDAYDAGGRDFQFQSSIYGAKSVKNLLIKSQSGKCCFCESKITHVAYGDVEHFRPKAGWVQSESDALTRPGYYWLAYAWPNLFLSCQLCNQRHKRNLFPLVNPTQRARSHHDNIANEQPVFVHPQDDDPEDFIAFHDEVAVGRDTNARGTTTIQRLGLNRDNLLERRMEALRRIRELKDVFLAFQQLKKQGRLPPDLKSKADRIAKFFKSLTQPEVEYSAMMKSFLSDVL